MGRVINETITRHELWQGLPHVLTIRSNRLDKVYLNEYLVEKTAPEYKKVLKEKIIARAVAVPSRRYVVDIVETPHRYKERIIETQVPVTVETSIERPRHHIYESAIEPAEFQPPPALPSTGFEYSNTLPRSLNAQENDTASAPFDTVGSQVIVVPKIRIIRSQCPVPIEVPRFMEYALTAESCDTELLTLAANCDEGLLDSLGVFDPSCRMQSAATAPTLSELDHCRRQIENLRFPQKVQHQQAAENMLHWWSSNELLIDETKV